MCPLVFCLSISLCVSLSHTHTHTMREWASEQANVNTNGARCVGGTSRMWKGCDWCVFLPFHTHSQRRRRQWRRLTPGVLRAELPLKICPGTTVWKKIMQSRFSRRLELSPKICPVMTVWKIMQNRFSRCLELSLNKFVQEYHCMKDYAKLIL